MHVRTLASMSYKFARRIPSTRVRRQAASPATSALVKRCFVIFTGALSSAQRV